MKKSGDVNREADGTHNGRREMDGRQGERENVRLMPRPRQWPQFVKSVEPNRVPEIQFTPASFSRSTSASARGATGSCAYRCATRRIASMMGAMRG